MYFSNFPVLPYTLDGGKTWQYLRDITIRTRIIEEHFNQVSMFNYFVVNDGASPEDIATEVYGTPYLHWVVLLCNDIIDPVMEWPFSEPRLRDHVWKKYRNQILVLGDFTGFMPPDSVIRQDMYRIRFKNGMNRLVEEDPVFATLVQQVSVKFWTDSTSFKMHPQKVIDWAEKEGIPHPDTVYLESNPSITARILDIEWEDIENVMNRRHHVIDENGIIKQEHFSEDGFLILEPGDRIVTNYEFESDINEKHREIKVLKKDYLRQFIDEFKRLINE